MIKNIRIQNFRSLVDVSVDLDPLTVLIGRSGTGKSNFVEAIRFLRDCLNSRTVSFEGLGGKRRVLHVDREKEALVYDVTFFLADSDVKYHYFLGIHHVPNNKHIEEWLAVGDKQSFHQAAGQWVVRPEFDIPLQGGIMLGAIPRLQESIFAYDALRSGIGCYDFPGNVLTGVGNQGNPTDNGFADHGDNYLLVANRIFSNHSKAHSWRRIEKSMRAVNRVIGSLILNSPTPDRIDVGHQLNGKALSFDVRQESEGFRRYLAHMLALYQNPPKRALFFEHPEAGLHPGALESLAYEFKACPEDDRGQVILTTHSPQLLDYFPPESLRVVDIKDQATQIGPVAPEQMASLREHLLLPGELLTVDPARLPGQLAEVPG